MPSRRITPRTSSRADDEQRAALADFVQTWNRRQSHGRSGNRTTPPEIGESPQSKAPDPSQPKLGPRLRQTLDRLLAGDAEKQIAHRLGLSRHTIHDYVKMIYRRFGVSSRAELLARWVRRPDDSAP